MMWPAFIPGFNFIENIWNMVARNVYTGKTQYSTFDELEQSVMNSWEKNP